MQSNQAYVQEWDHVAANTVKLPSRALLQCMKIDPKRKFHLLRPVHHYGQFRFLLCQLTLTTMTFQFLSLRRYDRPI